MIKKRKMKNSRKSINELKSFIDKPVSVALVGIAVLAFATYLAIKFGIAIFFAFLSIAIVLYFAKRTVKLTSKSLELTRESLELSRATQRPFLHVSRISLVWSRIDRKPNNIDYFVIAINNTGNLPADKLSIDFHVFKANEKRKKSKFIAIEPLAVCFPNQEIINLKFSESNANNKLLLACGDELNIQIKVNYSNKITSTSHKTVRSYFVRYTPTDQDDPMPLTQGNYWY